MMKVVKYDELEGSDLVVDTLYKGGNFGNVKDDPINKLLKGGNLGGFRYIGSFRDFSYPYIGLYSSLDDPNWPDALDLRTGVLTYYGDNKRAGHELHDTPRGGNLILKECFSMVAGNHNERVPPFFIFTKAGVGRDVVFRGLAVPGAKNMDITESLVSIWKTQIDVRFQNYRAKFTVLDVPIIPRKWIEDLESGVVDTPNCPGVFRKWRKNSAYSALISERNIEHRSREEQLPKNAMDQRMVDEIYSFYTDPYEFEKCACELILLMDQNIVNIDPTRPWMDGGRDGLGKYRIGQGIASIDIEFAVEAKRYAIGNAVGIKETSRLISRIRNRQFGILVTTSYLHQLAYKEIFEDGHPIIVISAVDIVEILKKNGITTPAGVRRWLTSINRANNG